MSLRDHTPALPRLLGPLLDGTADAPTLRPALVKHAERARVVVPTAEIPRARVDQLVAAGQPRSFDARHRANAVEYLLNHDAFVAFKEALDTARPGADQPFVLLVGWNIDPNTAVPGTHVTFGQALIEVARRGVPVFVLIWANDSPLGITNVRGHIEASAAGLPADHPHRFSSGLEPSYLGINRAWLDAFERDIAGVQNIQLVRDSHTKNFGTHHQKILIVNGTQGLVAFYGGIDITSERITSFSDVHARVRGPAAADLYALARARWEHAGHDTRLQARAASAVSVLADPIGALASAVTSRAAPPALVGATPSAGHSTVRVAQTAGNAAMARAFPHDDIAPVLMDAIGRARRYIYVEDQYFASNAIVDALAAALPHVKQVIVLLNRASGDENVAHRHNALRRLAIAAAHHPGKVGVFRRVSGGRWYVHAKVWIIDDELVIAGSCNLDARGFGVDSEVMVSAVHPGASAWDAIDLPRAQKLRMQLWHRHLNDFDESSSAHPDFSSGRIPAWRLLDPIAASAYWMELDRPLLHGGSSDPTRRRGRIEPYLDPGEGRPHWSQHQLYAERPTTLEGRLGMEGHP